MSEAHEELTQLLTPISGDNPAGGNLCPSSMWHQISILRETEDPLDKGIWDRPRKAPDRQTLRKLVWTALVERSKDLRLAAWLIEADTFLQGLPGTRHGCELLLALVSRYWKLGLHPQGDERDLEPRIRALFYFDRLLATALFSAPILSNRASNRSFALVELDSSKNESSSAVEIDSGTRLVDIAKAAGPMEIDRSLQDARACATTLATLGTVLNDEFSVAGVTFPKSTKALDEWVFLLQSMLRSSTETKDAESMEMPATILPSQRVEALVQVPSRDQELCRYRESVEALFRSKDADRQLATAIQQTASGQSGRTRFYERYILAELCAKSGRARVAKVLLRELSEKIEKHELLDWESPQLVAGVYLIYYRLLRAAPAGTEDYITAAQVFERLCRIDPAGALAAEQEEKLDCGDDG